jgi:hypothetical protein
MADLTKFEQSIIALHRLYEDDVETYKRKIADSEQSIKQHVEFQKLGSLSVSILSSDLRDLQADRAALEIIDRIANQLKLRLERCNLFPYESIQPSSKGKAS